MHAVNVIRIAISVFILMLLGISAAGWIWTGRNQPRPQADASHVVLTLGALAGVAGLVVLWRPRPPVR